MTTTTVFQVSPGLRGILRRHAEAFVQQVLPLLREQAKARMVAGLAQLTSSVPQVPAARRADKSAAGRQNGSDLDEVIENTKRIIQERFRSKTLTLDYLARRAGLSKFYLARRFQERVGSPIHHYLVDVRVARARELLEKGMRPMKVWRRTGFADQPHMTRVFQSRLGSTPKRFHLRVR